MLEEEEVKKLLKSIDKRIDFESNNKILSTIIMNKKLSKSINNYMINMANEASNYDWYNDGRRYYRGLRIIRTKDIKGFSVV